MGYNDERAEQNKDQSSNDGILKQKLDTEFPLSGGETEGEWEQATTSTDKETPEDTAGFSRRAATGLPLSEAEPGE